MARKICVKLILELRESGLSVNQIASSRHISKHSVSDVFRIAKEKDIRFKDIQFLDPDEVYRLVYPDKHVNETMYEEESNIFFHDYSNHIVNDDVLARLISMPNVIVTSHKAFLTKEALSNIADTTLANIREFFSSDRCVNEVCYKCGKITDCKLLHDKNCF